MSSFIRWVTRNTRNLITVLLLLLSFTLILSTGLRIYQNDQDNLVRRYLYHQFDPDENTAEGSDQYLNHVPMEEMDFPVFDISLGNGLLGFEPYIISATLPHDIVYYREVMGIKVPALTLKKGSVVSLQLESGHSIPYGYGFFTFPTYERGWRYAVPFEVDGEPFQWEGDSDATLSQETMDYYYVKLSDIIEVAQLLLSDDLDETVNAQPIGFGVYNAVFRIDHLLASDNIYLSPDIGGSVFTKWDVILLVASAGCFLLALILLLLSFRKTVR